MNLPVTTDITRMMQPVNGCKMVAKDVEELTLGGLSPKTVVLAEAGLLVLNTVGEAELQMWFEWKTQCYLSIMRKTNTIVAQSLYWQSRKPYTGTIAPDEEVVGVGVIVVGIVGVIVVAGVVGVVVTGVVGVVVAGVVGVVAVAGDDDGDDDDG